MNALRALLAHLVNTHVALAERITPAAFARVWTGVAVGALIGIAAVLMAWANGSGRIHP